MNIRADSQEKVKETYHLRGHVEVIYGPMRLTADEASYAESSGDMTAQGHVTYTDPDAQLEADAAKYNPRSSRGVFSNCRGHVRTRVRARPRMLVTENPFYFEAKQVERLDQDTFLLQEARLTPCECEKRGWSIAAAHTRLKLDDKIVAHRAIFRLVRVPLLYSPVMVNSIARRPRQSGLLMPHLGHSSQKGFIFGEGLFWAINRSADLTLGVENFTIRGPAAVGGFRARPSETSDVAVSYFGVADRGGGPLRQSRAPGQSLHAVGQAADLGWGFRGILDADYVSSLAFREAFSDNFWQAVSAEARQMAFMTKNFDAYSINIFASRYQDFLCAQARGTRNPNCPTAQGFQRDTISIRQTPSLSISGVDKQVRRSPFYLSFDASAAAVGRAEPGFETPRFSERIDFGPRVTLRSPVVAGFHITPSAGLRATHYGTSLAKRDSLNRLLGEFSLDLRPPPFDKVLARRFRGQRLKHVIEPDIRYRLVRGPGARDMSQIVRFDEIDILAETSEIEYSLTNSVLMRKDAPRETVETPQARELVSLRLSQKYYFDPTFGGALVPGQKMVFEPTVSLTGFAFARGRRLSPLVSVLKFAPLSNYDTEVRADFSPTGGGVLNAGITSHLHRGPIGIAATDFFVNRTAVLSSAIIPAGSLSQLPSYHLLRIVGTYGDMRRKGFSSALGLDYNLAQGIAHQVVGQASYNFGCFAVDFEARRFALGAIRRENQFRIALSLANVGSFGTLRPGERLY